MSFGHIVRVIITSIGLNTGSNSNYFKIQTSPLWIFKILKRVLLKLLKDKISVALQLVCTMFILFDTSKRQVTDSLTIS